MHRATDHVAAVLARQSVATGRVGRHHLKGFRRHHEPGCSTWLKRTLAGTGKAPKLGVDMTDLLVQFAQCSGPNRVAADKLSHERRRRAGVELVGRRVLFDASLVHDDDAVRHRERLGLGMRDKNEGDPQVALQQLQFALDVLAQVGVERAERLVEQQNLRFDHQPTRQRDALALAARQALRRLLRDIEQVELVENAIDLEVAFGLGHLLDLQPVPDIAPHRQVREQGVILEDHRRRAALCRQVVDAVPANQQVATGDGLEPRDHPQGRCLAAARGAEQGDELTLLDVEIDVDHRRGAVVVHLADADELKVVVHFDPGPIA